MPTRIAIETSEQEGQKAPKGGDTCSDPLLEVEKKAQTWDEKNQRCTQILMVICRLANERPKEIERGFTSIDIVGKFKEVTGNAWEFQDPESKMVGKHWKKLQDLLDKKKIGIIQHLAGNGFKNYPKFVITNKGGGSGNETRYSVEFPRIDKNQVIDDSISGSDINAYEIPEGWIRYICEDVEGLSKHLTKGWRIQLTILLWLIGIVSLIYYGIISLTLLYDKSNILQLMPIIFIGAIFAGIAWVFFSHLLTVNAKRITPIASIFQSTDNNHLIELKTPKGKPKQVKLVMYSGECPICEGRVTAKSGGFSFYGRIIGKCENNPVEHIFSFDHVTRRGKPLR